MTDYAYRAVSGNGAIFKGRMDAANLNDLSHHLRALDLDLIDAKPKQNSFAAAFSLSQRKTPRDEDIIHLCGQLSNLLATGMTASDALDMLVKTMQASPLRDALVSVGRSIAGGTSVSNAFAKQNDFFSPMLTSLLASAEAGGDLPAAFAKIKDQLQWQHNIKRDLSRAIRYPLFLLCVAIGVTSFMMLYVVPQLIAFLLTLGNDLPLTTRMLIKAAELFAHGWWVIPILLSLPLAVHGVAAKRDLMLSALASRFELQTPVIGPLLSRFALARFFAAFALLLQSGHTSPLALEKAAKASGNLHIELFLEQAHKLVISGTSLSAALAPALSPYAIQLLKVAESCGRLEPAIHELAHLHEQQAREKSQDVIATLEPILTIIVGCLLAYVVLAVLGPVYGSLGALSRGM